ncbi:hypothetical protein FH063_001477 [Azospirillum argentinense]|uniref:Uncharacterized protein n=1 Tax=Azospirillum argentinense TaxID=2970906 RepID=A0A5B0KYW5_9PROT|nr:hypothetical protein FH063_001477 [Azospirillum argentinense]
MLTGNGRHARTWCRNRSAATTHRSPQGASQSGEKGGNDSVILG